MVANSPSNPLALIGRELHIELVAVLGSGRLGTTRLQSKSTPQVLPEQRVEDTAILEVRKADTLLQMVRHGAVRR